MSAELAQFDTRRIVQNDESSEQTDFRVIGAREHGQLALDELDTIDRGERTSVNTQTAAEEPTREDLEAALGCARATIDGLRDQATRLEAERDRLLELVAGADR